MVVEDYRFGRLDKPHGSRDLVPRLIGMALLAASTAVVIQLLGWAARHL